MGRFINADAFVSTGTGLLGTNMFAYCNCNPIYFSDPTGHASWGTNTVAICDGGTGDGRGINPSAHKSHPYIPAEYDDSLSKDIKDTYNAAVTWIDNNWKHVVDGITTVVGLGCSVVGTLATASVIAIPIGGQIILGVTGIACSVWSAGRYFEIW